MANGEGYTLLRLFIYLLSLPVILLYPYIALNYFTKRKSIFMFYLCNMVLFLFLLVSSSELSSENSTRNILRFLRVFYLLLPVLYYQFIERYKNNKNYFMNYLTIVVIHCIMYFNFLI